MKRKYLVGLLCTLMLSSMLTACGDNQKGSGAEQTSQASSQSETEEETSPTRETEEESEEESETETTASDSESGYEPVSNEDFVPVEGLDESYVNMDCMKFAYNGTVYTLGETTFQELVDADVPFSESDLNNIGNNVNSNYSTAMYTVDLNDYNYLQFEFANFTDSNCTEAECVLTDVRWSTLYAPNTEYEDSLNEEIETMLADAAKSVGFSFPLTLTEEELLEVCPEGEVNDSSTYTTTVEYSADAEKYLGSRYARFSFDATTNRLKEVSFSWLP